MSCWEISTDSQSDVVELFRRLAPSLPEGVEHRIIGDSVRILLTDDGPVGVGLKLCRTRESAVLVSEPELLPDRIPAVVRILGPLLLPVLIVLTATRGRRLTAWLDDTITADPGLKSADGVLPRRISRSRATLLVSPGRYFLGNSIWLLLSLFVAGCCAFVPIANALEYTASAPWKFPNFESKPITLEYIIWFGLAVFCGVALAFAAGSLARLARREPGWTARAVGFLLGVVGVLGAAAGTVQSRNRAWDEAERTAWERVENGGPREVDAYGRDIPVKRDDYYVVLADRGVFLLYLEEELEVLGGQSRDRERLDRVRARVAEMRDAISGVRRTSPWRMPEVVPASSDDWPTIVFPAIAMRDVEDVLTDARIPFDLKFDADLHHAGDCVLVLHTDTDVDRVQSLLEDHFGRPR